MEISLAENTQIRMIVHLGEKRSAYLLNNCILARVAANSGKSRVTHDFSFSREVVSFIRGCVAESGQVVASAASLLGLPATFDSHSSIKILEIAKIFVPR